MQIRYPARRAYEQILFACRRVVLHIANDELAAILLRQNHDGRISAKKLYLLQHIPILLQRRHDMYPRNHIGDDAVERQDVLVLEL